MSMKLTKHRPLSLQIGHVSNAPDAKVVFTDEELATHMAIYGGTGKGKSKLIELILRQIFEQGAGACIIDPHGDLVEDLLGHILERHGGVQPDIVKRVHYFEPGSSEYRFAYDPFFYEPVPGEDYRDWLHAKVMSIAQVILRKQGEAGFEGKPRLERFLKNVLYAAGQRINERGDHLGLADAPLLLDTAHGLHPQIYGKIAPHLPSDIRSDFNRVFESKRPRDQENWTESTINRLRSFLSHSVRQLFTPGVAPTLNFREIIEQRGIMLVNLRRTRSFTLDQGSAVGGLFINEILEAAQIANRTARQPYYLIVDEATRFVGQDLISALAQCRKWKLSIGLAVQDLSSLKTNEIDMTAKVLSQCGIHISFQQKHPDDLELLGQLFGYPLLDFTPLRHEVDRFNGYKEVHTTDYSSSTARNEGKNAGNGWAFQYRENLLDYAEDKSSGYTRSKNESASSSNSRTEGVTRKTSHLSTYRTEVQETGRLREAVADQFHRFKQQIRTLGKGQAAISVDGTPPFIMNVHHVNTPFETLPEERRFRLVEQYKQFLGKSHPYCFRPDPNMHETDRLKRFLAAPSAVLPEGFDPAAQGHGEDGFGI